MDDKIYWMYGFWVLVSGAKSVQAIWRLVDFHRFHVAAPPERVMLAGFWTVAFLFYGYMSWRRWKMQPAGQVS